ncbi:uncharacterized protein PF07_0021-like [Piliocolobus tephrosceles]|uniref:uncharacterized protein PF07_0021-like n=1 Tax=Piliocolobus tephrosceles TaxID=591936 RepID=UPI000E6B3413|nr:uncharacterized protein PF07_0021-like [Piliocolobus tephrosceles]
MCDRVESSVLKLFYEAYVNRKRNKHNTEDIHEPTLDYTKRVIINQRTRTKHEPQYDYKKYKKEYMIELIDILKGVNTYKKRSNIQQTQNCRYLYPCNVHYKNVLHLKHIPCFKNTSNEINNKKKNSHNLEKCVDNYITMRKYIRKEIYKILKMSKHDSKIRSILTFMVNYIQMNGSSFVMSDIIVDPTGRDKNTNKTNVYVTKNDKNKKNVTVHDKIKKKKREREREREREKKKHLVVQYSTERKEFLSGSECEKMYVNNVPKHLPLTMLIVKNFEEKQEKLKGVKKYTVNNTQVQYQVKLVGTDKKKIKENQKIIKNEVGLFSRIEHIYNNVGEVKRNINYDNNIVNRYIPFPNIATSYIQRCNTSDYMKSSLTEIKNKEQELVTMTNGNNSDTGKIEKSNKNNNNTFFNLKYVLNKKKKFELYEE